MNTFTLVCVVCVMLCVTVEGERRGKASPSGIVYNMSLVGVFYESLVRQTFFSLFRKFRLCKKPKKKMKKKKEGIILLL